MKLDDWKPVKRTEVDYAAELTRALYDIFFVEDNGQRRLRMLSMPQWLEAYSRNAARRMVTGAYVRGARSWREAALTSGSRQVYESLQKELRGPVGRRVSELIETNARLIRSLPEDVALRASELAARGALKGDRAATLERLLLVVSRQKARLLARTETSKASTALTRARAENLGLFWYDWQTSKDERVRLSHKKMQGVLVRFTDPPAPEVLAGERDEGRYNAGDIYNCRCYPAPVVKPEILEWPHKVYWSGRVKYMTLAAFRNLNLQLQEAA